MGFALSKIISGFLTPSAIILIAFVVSKIISARPNGRVLGKNLRRWLLALLVIITVFPVGAWALLPLENAFPANLPAHVDGIILLGGDEDPHISAMRGQPTAYSSAQRYLHFIALAHQYPQAKLIFTGGSGRIFPAHEGREADVARQSLAATGLPVDRMVFEDKSHTTYENAILTADLIHPKPSQNWLLVTNGWHMPRSMAVFRKAGWVVYPAPTGYITDGHFRWFGSVSLGEHLLELGQALHEYCGLVVYRLLGRTDQLWPHAA